MDLKYRESLPASVREAVLAVSDDEGVLAKKRKTKKKKLGKNGFYPKRMDLSANGGRIEAWWVPQL